MKKQTETANEKQLFDRVRSEMEESFDEELELV